MRANFRKNGTLGVWRGAASAKMRKLIQEGDSEVVETWKRVGMPMREHNGIVCTGGSYKGKIKLTFAKGASLKRAYFSLQLQPLRQPTPCARGFRVESGGRCGLQGPQPRGDHTEWCTQDQARKNVLRLNPGV